MSPYYVTTNTTPGRINFSLKQGTTAGRPEGHHGRANLVTRSKLLWPLSAEKEKLLEDPPDTPIHLCCVINY